MKVANIGLYKCPSFDRLKPITRTEVETRMVVVVVVVRSCVGAVQGWSAQDAGRV